MDCRGLGGEGGTVELANSNNTHLSEYSILYYTENF